MIDTKHIAVFTGTRHGGSEATKAITERLKQLHSEHGDGLRVIHGGAPGCDTIVQARCDELGIWCTVTKVPFNNMRLRKRAGPARNQLLLSDAVAIRDAAPSGQISLSINAFLDFRPNRDTEHCLAQSQRMGVFDSYVVLV